MFATLIGPYPSVPGSPDERLRGVLGDQLDAGIGMLTDGLVHRVDGDPRHVVRAWQEADAVAHELAADAGLEPPILKACLLGPWTATDGDPHRLALATGHVADALRLLVDAGAAVVQVTEPAIAAIDPDDDPSLDRLGGMLEVLAAAGIDAGGHVSLAITGGRSTSIDPAVLLAAPFGSYLFDPVTAPDDWTLCARVPAECGLIVGVHDARPGHHADEAVTIWGARYAASMSGRGPARVGVTASAGLELLSRTDARAVLAAVAQAGRRAELPDEELARVLDPRAVDARSAALGRYAPRVAPPRPRRPAERP